MNNPGGKVPKATASDPADEPHIHKLHNNNDTLYVLGSHLKFENGEFVGLVQTFLLRACGVKMY